MNTSRTFLNKLALPAVLISALFLRLWHINWGLPEVYEETFPFSVAWQMWNWGKSGIDLNPHFFNYPSLTMYLNFIVQGAHYAIGHLIGAYPDVHAFEQSYQSDPTLHIVLARVISVGFDMGTIFMLWKLGSRVGGKMLGFLAGGLGAINPMLIQQSHFVSVDTPLAFFSLAALYYIYRISEDRRLMYYYMCGLSVGLAAAAKYTGAMILPVLFLIHILNGTNTWKSFVKQCFEFKFIVALFIAVGAFFICNPYIIFSFGEFYRDFAFEGHHMSTGHLGADPSVFTGVFYFFRVFPNAFGWVFYACIIGGIVALVVSRKQVNIFLLLFPILYMAIISTWQMRADRYVLPAIPILILIGSAGIVVLVERIQALTIPDLSKYVVFSLVTVVILFEPVGAVGRYQRSIALPDTREVAQQWVEQNIPRGSAIATTAMRMKFPEATYQVLPIPFYPIVPERMAPFYDTRWYEDFDLVMGSDYDLARFQQEPQRYGKFLKFYETLSKNWTLAYEVEPEGGQPGPRIWMYRPPDSLKKNLFPEDLYQPFYKAGDSSKPATFIEVVSIVMMKKRQIEKAEQTAKHLVSLDADNAESLKLLITFLKQVGRLEDALPISAMYVQSRPRNAEFLYLQGWICFNLQRYDEAESSYKQALSSDPNYENAYTGLYSIYAGRKDKKNALGILARYYSILPPGSKQAEDVLSAIEELKTMR